MGTHRDDVARSDEARLRARADVDDQQRLLELGLVRNGDDRAVGDVGGVQRHDRLVVDAVDLQQPVRRRVGLIRKGAAERHHGEARHAARVRQRFGDRTHRRRRRASLRASRADPAPRRAALPKRARTRPRLGGSASFMRLRRSVYFHASMRRCGRPSALKRPMASSRRFSDGRAARQLVGDCREGLGQRLLRLGLQHRYVHLAPPQRLTCARVRAGRQLHFRSGLHFLADRQCRLDAHAAFPWYSA